MKEPIYPCLWFDGKARQAAEFYCSVFPDSRIISETPLVVYFDLNGRKFMGLNGGPIYKITEGISFIVECETQEEIDHYWDMLTEGGEENIGGWLKDKFGVSWQIIPAILQDLIQDPVKWPKVVQAFMKMRKFNIKKLEEAVK